MSTSISSGVGDLLCFTTFYLCSDVTLTPMPHVTVHTDFHVTHSLGVLCCAELYICCITIL